MDIILDKVQIKRGARVYLPQLDPGELAFCTDTGELAIGTVTGNAFISLTSTKTAELKRLGISNNGKLVIDGTEYSSGASVESVNNIQSEIITARGSFGSLIEKLNNMVISGGGSGLPLRNVSVGESFFIGAATTPTNVYGNIILNKTAATLNEGTTTTFTVVLDKAPTNNQTITISKDNADVTTDKLTLTFTPANYNVAQTVTISTVVDSDMANDLCTITVSSANVTSKTLLLTITDTTVDTGTSTPLTGIALNKTTGNLNTGNTDQLTVTFTPSNATNKNIVWSSSNVNIASVSNSGLVTAVGVGSATITATSEDGGFIATCAYTVAASNFAGTQKAYIQDAYLYVDPSTILDSDISIRAEGEATHKYFSMSPFTNTINLGLATANAGNASNVFNGVIPYAGEQVLGQFTAGSLSVPDTCYITYNGAIYIRIPIAAYTNNGNSIPLALYSISQRLPVLKGAANEEYLLTDAIINSIASLSTITVTNNMWTGFANMAAGIGAYTSITTGVNSICGRFLSSVTTREMWYVNATTRLNFKIPQSQLATADLASVKQYLKDNRLTFWVAK